MHLPVGSKIILTCKTNKILFPTALLVLLLLAPQASGDETLLYEYDSVYHHIRVVQNGQLRGMRFDNNHYQTQMYIDNPLTGHFNYVDLLWQAWVLHPEPENLLILGLGGASAQRLIHHYQPDLDILTVELDPAVVDIAEAYFLYNRAELPVEISDARAWLRRSPEKFDIIIQDTYSSNNYGTFIPFHLATYEYWNIVRNHLSDDGVLAVNVIGTVYGGESNRVITSVYRTMHEVFDQLYLFAANDVQNVVVIATQDGNRLSEADLMAIASELVHTRGDEFPGDLMTGSFQFRDTLPSRLADAIILTDDYAPTDNLLR